MMTGTVALHYVRHHGAEMAIKMQPSASLTKFMAEPITDINILNEVSYCIC